MTRLLLRLRIAAFIASTLAAGLAAGAPPVGKLKVPEGFQVELYASGIENARSMALAPDGTLFVGTRSAGRVYAIPSGPKREAVTIARKLDMPNGVAFRDGALYVAEVSRVLRYDGILGRLRNPPAPKQVGPAFPSDRHHGWKFIAFGPDGLLYVPIGAPCNVCLPADPRFATITRMKPDGTGFEIFARGVRNSVGFAWRPGTEELWFTDNGRDWLGDDLPPDELDFAPRAGLHFGFPYCHGRSVADPEYGAGKPCSGFTPPALELGAHVAALGMRFQQGDAFPAEWRGDAYIALHGSWNRSRPSGYQVVRVRMRDGKAVAAEPFLSGFLDDSGAAWGRPVDVLFAPDGAMLVSDDFAGAIYRVTYRKR